MKRTYQRRFTLIELLVVVAIIAVLAAMLLPALSKARKKARGAVCVGNFKQIVMTFQNYADDNDQAVPWSWNHFIDGNFPQFKQQNWTIMLYPYLNDLRFYLCPSRTSEDFDPVLQPTVIENCHYMLNPWFGYQNMFGALVGPGNCGSRYPASCYPCLPPPVYINGMDDAAKTVCLVDKRFIPQDWSTTPGCAPFTGRYTAGPSGDRESIYSYSYDPAFPYVSWAPNFGVQSHFGRANVSFMDGHVEQQDRTSGVLFYDMTDYNWRLRK